MKTVTVRWLPEYSVSVGGRLIAEGDTFDMPADEARDRSDVAVVEDAPDDDAPVAAKRAR